MLNNPYFNWILYSKNRYVHGANQFLRFLNNQIMFSSTTQFHKKKMLNLFCLHLLWNRHFDHFRYALITGFNRYHFCHSSYFRILYHAVASVNGLKLLLVSLYIFCSRIYSSKIYNNLHNDCRLSRTLIKIKRTLK